MSKSEARRQKQLAKKKAKRVEKRTFLARANSDNPMIRLAQAEAWPILESLVPEELWERGMGNLVLARRMPDGQIAAAFFLVDTYCLGVKDAFWKILPGSEYEKLKRDIARKQGALNPVPADYFAKLVFGAVDYARSFGFAPHADYSHARLLLQGIDTSACTDTFEFGKDGTPFFVSGPFDTPEKIKVIMHRLSQVGGHYLVGLDPADELQLVDESE